MAGRVHAVVDGEVPADQISSHGSLFAGQEFGLADFIGLVFAVIDPDDAGVSCAGATVYLFVKGLWPTTTATKTCKEQNTCYWLVWYVWFGRAELANCFVSRRMEERKRKERG